MRTMRHGIVFALIGSLIAGSGCATASKAPAEGARPAASSPATGRAATPSGAVTPPGGPTLAPPPVSLQPPPTPATAPEGDYKVAPKDQLAIHVYGQEDLSRTVRVSETGTITLPLLGEVPVVGLSPKEVEEKLESGLRGRYLLNPKVTVSVTEFQGRQVAVMGAVNQPGSYALKSNSTTVLLAMSEAKGVKENADRVAYVLRAKPRQGEPQPVTVDLEALLRSGDPRQNVVLEPGDSVYVPEANTYYVAGEVEKRGAYTLRRDTTISKAITEAGGVTNRAATREIKIVRTLPTGEKKEIGGIDLKAVMAGDRSQDVALQAQDVVVVPASGAKTAAYGVLDFFKGIFSIGISP